MRVALSDADLRRIDAWRVEFAAAFLETYAERFVAAGLPQDAVEREIRILRDRLVSCIYHLKAEARRLCLVREEERRAATAAAGESEPRPPDAANRGNRHEGLPRYAEYVVGHAALLWIDSSPEQRTLLQSVLFPEGLRFREGRFGTAVTCLAFTQ